MPLVYLSYSSNKNSIRFVFRELLRTVRKIYRYKMTCVIIVAAAAMGWRICLLNLFVLRPYYLVLLIANGLIICWVYFYFIDNPLPAIETVLRISHFFVIILHDFPFPKVHLCPKPKYGQPCVLLRIYVK